VLVRSAGDKAADRVSRDSYDFTLGRNEYTPWIGCVVKDRGINIHLDAPIAARRVTVFIDKVLVLEDNRAINVFRWSVDARVRCCYNYLYRKRGHVVQYFRVLCDNTRRDISVKVRL